MNKIPVVATFTPGEFLHLWYKYEKIGVPDPTQTAINELLYPVRVAIAQPVRTQLEDLVAYWRSHAKPGKVLAAQRSLHFVQSLQHWKPTGEPQ